MCSLAAGGALHQGVLHHNWNCINKQKHESSHLHNSSDARDYVRPKSVTSLDTQHACCYVLTL